MTTGTTETPTETSPAPDPRPLRERIERIADGLEERTAGRDTVAALFATDLGEVDRNGYLDGLSTAARLIRGALHERAGDDVLADTADVATFMRAMDQTVRTVPTTDITDKERVLRARIVLEEALEFVEAMGCDVVVADGYSPVTKKGVLVEVNPEKSIDLVEATDAMADIVVVVKGSAHTLGVPVDAAFDIVQVTNMAKVGGPVREDGKREKPEGWVGPTENLRALLVERGWNG